MSLNPSRWVVCGPHLPYKPPSLTFRIFNYKPVGTRTRGRFKLRLADWGKDDFKVLRENYWRIVAIPGRSDLTIFNGRLFFGPQPSSGNSVVSTERKMFKTASFMITPVDSYRNRIYFRDAYAFRTCVVDVYHSRSHNLLY
ncbi:hypothetical protein TNCV_1432891 [Trichonephila clavipes]|nr:hypothetical protein TNCV_1432891 [Trichonephila clavipes]